jgi:hypothetical protein
VRQATDAYLSRNNIRLLLNRIDYTGWIGVKTECPAVASGPMREVLR